jgi:predicted HicB family RNase H-like nuclease
MPKKKVKTKDGTNVRVGKETHKRLRKHTDIKGLRMTAYVDTAINEKLDKDQNGVQFDHS